MRPEDRKDVARAEIHKRVHKFLGLKKQHPEIKNFIEEPEQHKDTLFENTRLKLDLLSKKDSERFRSCFESRRMLPVMQRGLEILNGIKNNQVVLVVGGKGCGKTTQIPQLIMDEYIFNNRASECRIACLQTTGENANKAGERVSFERDEDLGNSAGIEIKRRRIAPRENGSVVFCTAGLFIKKCLKDPFMTTYSVVILDDIQQKTFEFTQIMGLLEIILPFRPNFKVVLLSRTPGSKKFARFFKLVHTFHIDGAEAIEQKKQENHGVSQLRKVQTDSSSQSMAGNKHMFSSEPKTNKAPTKIELNHKAEELRAKNEYRKAIGVLWEYANKNFRSFSHKDIALIEENRQSIMKFEKMFPQLKAGGNETAVLLEKTKLFSPEKEANSRKQSTLERKGCLFVRDLEKTTKTNGNVAVKEASRNEDKCLGMLEKKLNLPIRGDENSASTNGSVAVKRPRPSEYNCYGMGDIARSTSLRDVGNTSATSAKRCRSNDDKSITNLEKNYNSFEELSTAKKKRTLNNNDLQVAIVDWSDPDGYINAAKWSMLEERLLTEMISDRWNNEIILFDGTEWFQGVKVIKCADERSLQFLEVAIASFGEVWPRAQLGIIPQSALPLRIYVNMLIPPPVPSMRDIFELLGKQNQGLVTGDWQIISSNPTKNNMGMTFRLAIDKNTSKQLTEMKGRVRFGFGFINIQPDVAVK